VIKPALKGQGQGIGPVIRDINCTNCGRCIDVCSKDVFRFRIGGERASPGHQADRGRQRVAPG